MEKVFTVITLCGSMRFYNEMLFLACLLTVKGYIVLMPFVHTRDIEIEGEKKEELKDILDTMHKAKIDMCDIALIVNCTKENIQETYVGLSTISEMHYADENSKKVLFYDALIKTRQLVLDSSIVDAL